jgi:hypothetical protein
MEIFGIYLYLDLPLDAEWLLVLKLAYIKILYFFTAKFILWWSPFDIQMEILALLALRVACQQSASVNAREICILSEVTLMKIVHPTTPCIKDRDRFL